MGNISKRTIYPFCLLLLIIFSLLVISRPEKIFAVASISGKCGSDAYWSLDNGVLTITGTGIVVETSTSTGGVFTYPWTEYKDEIVEVVVEDGITEIRSKAFTDCIALKKVSIADTVTELWTGVFSGCLSLNDVDLGNGITFIPQNCFSGCIKLKEIELPENALGIGSYAFAGCAITSITLGDNVTELAENAFSECAALKTIYMGSSVKTIKKNAFYDCTTINFYYNGSIKDWCSISIHDTALQSVAWYLYIFNGNDYISTENLIIPTDVIRIPEGAFRGCCSIKTLIINDNVILIDDYAFENCKNIESVEINGVTKVNDAFSYCARLKSFSLKGNVSDVSSLTLGDCTSLIDVNITDNVVLRSQFFYGCTSLKSVKLPSAQTSIGDDMFHDCFNLESVAFSNNVTSVEDEAFDGCNKLKYIFYDGTETEWTNISLSQYGNTSLKSAVIHYNSSWHTINDWDTTKDPSCENPGVKEKQCIYCDYTETGIVESLGHDYNSEFIIDIPETCTQSGIKSHHCIRCNKSEEGSEIVIPAKGHQWNSTYTVDKKATYATAGSQSIHCAVCNTIKPNSTVSITKLKVKATTLTKVTAAKKGFTVKWKKGTGVSGYEIQYALNNKYTKGKKVVKITKPGTVSKKVTKLKAKKKYFVRIRTYKTVSGKKYYSAWSKAKSVTTSNNKNVGKGKRNTR